MDEITVEQVKAARALLNWTQKDLANYTNLNQAIIANYESKRSNSYDVQKAIYRAFVANGIKFIDGGVLPQRVSYIMFETYYEMLMDVEKTLNKGDSFYVHCADERKSPLEVIEKTKEMSLKGIKKYLTIPEDSSKSTILGKEFYRIIPQDYIDKSWDAIAIYKNKVGFMVEDEKRLVIISDHLSQLFYNQFEYWWDRGQKIS